MRSRSAALAIAAITLSAAALADTSGTLTLAGLTSLDLDTGATSSLTGGGGIPTGDLFWTGTSIAPAASGVIGVLASQTGQAAFDNLTQAQLAATTIPAQGGTFTFANGLANNNILIYKTKSGKFSKILITSFTNGNTSLGIKFLTFGGTGGTTGGGPTITTVQNNSQIAPGQPNYGIAPGSIFFVKGINLATIATNLQSSASPGLQTTLQNVTVTVSVGSATLLCPLYYVLPDSVLPDGGLLGLRRLPQFSRKTPQQEQVR